MRHDRRATVRQRYTHALYGGRPAYFTLAVYETVAQVRAAANTYRGTPGEFDNCAGCFHPSPEGTEEHSGWAGIMRLSLEKPSVEIVAHETVHAAATVYRMFQRPVINLGNGCHRNEELFSYIYGDFLAATVNKLYALGVWG